MVFLAEDVPRRMRRKMAGRPEPVPTREPVKRGTPVVTPTQPRPPEKKKGLLESLLGFFGGGGGSGDRGRQSGRPSNELDKEVDELMEQLEGAPAEATAADEKPAEEKKKGGRQKAAPKADDKKKGTGATVQAPPAEPPNLEGLTYRERRRIEREQARALQGGGMQGRGAQEAAAGTGRGKGGAPAADAGAQPTDAQSARLARRQQRMAGRQQPASAQPQAPAQAEAAGEAPGELASLNVEDLLSSGRKRKKGKPKADELEDLDEEGLEDEAGLGAEGDLGGEGESDEDVLKELAGEEGEAELLTKKCPHCRRQALDIAFCPNCGAGMCDKCAPGRAKILDQVKWTCPACKAQFKVKAKKGAEDEEGLDDEGLEGGDEEGAEEAEEDEAAPAPPVTKSKKR